MALLSTASDLLLFYRVNEAINAFLMQIKSLLGFVGEIRRIVHVDETIQGRGKESVQVFIELNLCDPAPVSMHLLRGKTLLSTSVQSRPRILTLFTILISPFYARTFPGRFRFFFATLRLTFVQTTCCSIFCASSRCRCCPIIICTAFFCSLLLSEP